jgi:Holliday junction resolvase
MSTASKKKGTAAEREVVNYLMNWWPNAERRALSGNKDKGDVAGIPGVVVEVKAAARQELAKWQRETLAEQKNANADFCLLVVKRPYKSVGEWDAYMPQSQVVGLGGEETAGWVRMDLQLAVRLLLMCRSVLCSRTTA